MSKKDETASAEEQGDQNTDSVFDFLYHDHRRIASFLSQFDANGLLTGLTQSEGVTKGSKRSKRVGIGGELALLGGGNVEFEMGPGESGSETLERVYDPYWTNARQFLDVLQERSMVERNLRNASIGQIVLATGYLSIQDLGMMKEAWNAPAIKSTIMAGAGGGKRKGNMTAAQKAAAKEEENNTKLFLELIQLMPHSVHARMLTRDDSAANLVWCVLNQENLVTSASDVALTYGYMMSGEWSILGILNAQPEYLTPDLKGEFDENDLGLTESIVGQVSKLLAPVVRVSLGRPSAAFGITPLLIFREVS